jgi:hypothetical protein
MVGCGNMGMDDSAIIRLVVTLHLYANMVADPDLTTEDFNDDTIVLPDRGNKESRQSGSAYSRSPQISTSLLALFLVENTL